MSNLLKPLQAGCLPLSSRLVLPPMATSKAEPDGKVSSAILDYYQEKSAGGYFSLIIIEHSYVQQAGKASENQLSVADDSVIDGLKELAAVIHRNGSKAVMQINHAGSATTQKVTGAIPVGPSAVKNPRKGDVPHELTQQELREIIAAFSAAAGRVKQAGFDGVEIHSAHGYFLNQFFSPLTNRRTDEYGGDVLGRIRIHQEVIEAVRATVGEEFPILLRLGAADYIDGGTTIADSQIAAREFEKAGIAILDISGGFSGYTIPGNNEQGYFASLSAAVKEVVSIPVILTGGITEAQAAEQLLAQGKADLIGVGRAVLHDSLWAKKAVDSIK
ncbi:NADH:flavin oxidoreductase [Sporomusa sp. KB1]|uniref:NADH:flavin oxidoreductase n=1 Tax=Sporomusa sp. KB1 TaxID=943346 RepID=UPI00119E1F29|nr:NADH:flavin oxidoreductase [Sporomusa sp. KB1]TWH47510.1 2,4-dienoyl-CoA reductase-like NADH-dependent reductase (Old Yellow Enzyme family) [Sporomusa sp. KB1]